MGNKPQVLAQFKQGKLIGTVAHFAETMNWLVPFVANLKGEEGIAIKNPSTDHPLLELNIVAGEGIKITKSNGQMTISTTKEKDDKPTTKKSGGSGSGSGGGSGGGGGGSGGGSGSGGYGTGGNGGGNGGGSSGGSGGGSSGGGEGNGTNCNQWSDDLENGWGGGSPSNEGDSCTILNKW